MGSTSQTGEVGKQISCLALLCGWAWPTSCSWWQQMFLPLPYAKVCRMDLVHGPFLPAANSSAGKSRSKWNNWMLGHQDLALVSVFKKVNYRITVICNVAMWISELLFFPVLGPVTFSFVSVHKHWGFHGWTTLKFPLCKIHISFDVGCECLGTRFLKAMIQPCGTNASTDLHKQITIQEDFLFILLLYREILVSLMKDFTNSKFKTKVSSCAEETVSRRMQTLSCASVRCKIQTQTPSFWKLCIPTEHLKNECALKPSGEHTCSLLLPWPGSQAALAAAALHPERRGSGHRAGACTPEGTGLQKSQS